MSAPNVLGDLPLAPLSPEDHRAVWRTRIAIAVAVLLLHVLLLLFRPGSWLVTAPPPRVELTQIDPTQLDRIKKAWERNRNEGKLLLKKDDAPAAEEPAPDARYQSDRNRVVEREQQGRRQETMPRPMQQARTGSETAKRTADVSPKKLSRLALPMNLNGNQPVPSREASEQSAARAQEETPPGADQALLDEDLPVGGETLLNTRQSQYYSFYSRLYEAIGPLWLQQVRQVPYSRRIMAGEYVAIVEIVLDREGNLDGIRWIQSAGLREFDDAVETAWKKIRRFPNPPAGLLERDGRVRIGWRFDINVGQNTGVDASAPRRTY